MNIKSINDPRELLAKDNPQSHYEFDNFIKIESWRERSRSKKKLNLLKTIDPVISKILDDDEQVYYLTKGLKVTKIDYLFIGWAAHYYNLFCFVFTTKRVLLVHLTRGTTLGKYVCEINYENLIKIYGFWRLKVKLKNGKSLSFAKVPAYDRKFIVEFIKSILPEESSKDKTLPGIKNLCPSCYAHVVGYPANCASCNAAFKTPRKAALLSFIMPGLGDLYLGSKFLGTFELLVMLFIWATFVIGAIGEASSGGNLAAILTPLIITLLFMHSLDALKSSYIARKGIALSYL